MSSSGRHSGKTSSEYGDTLLSQIRTALSTNDYTTADRKASELLTSYPGFDGADEVYILAAQANLSLGNASQAAKYAKQIPERYPMSEHAEEAFFVLGDAYAVLEMPYESADAYSKLLESPISPEDRRRALGSLRDAARNTTVTDLEKLIGKYPSSPLAAEMSIGLAKKEFARGNYDRAYILLSELLYQFPQHKDSPEIRQLLKLSATRKEDPQRRLDNVKANTVGVLLPVTGNFSRFGRYFEEGITLALDDHNAAGKPAVVFVKADSKGNPIDAVAAARRLVVEEGAVAVLGSVFTMPSVAAAVECNAWRVPMLSPVISEDRLDEIGPWVFQTKISRDVEVSAIARVAADDLLLERYAILAPTSTVSRQLTQLFIQSVTQRGGVIVAEEYYTEGATDFRDQLEVIRDASPEALFIPGGTEELILILPQVSFYDMQLQLLGLSNWNSEKLLRLSQRELEGALFPGEAYHGRSRESTQDFLNRYEERFGGEVHPVTASGYFGMRLLLDAVESGAVDRLQLKEYLHNELTASAEQRMQEANSLSILKVQSGRAREFTAVVRKK